MTDNAGVPFLYKAIVVGTPRTYGNSKNDDIWRQTIVAGQWESNGNASVPISSVHLDLEFRVNPSSHLYRRRVSVNGPDLDTMIIGALGGLLHCRNTQRPTRRIIQHGGLCRVVKASKRLVEGDNESGFTLHVREGGVSDFRHPLIESELSFFVARQHLKADCRRAVQQAAEQANPHGFRAPRADKLEITLSFAEGITRNPLSAGWLEAVIDGLGASRVGNERFFDGPPTQQFGYDDSNVFKLTVAQVRGLSPSDGLHVSCKALSESIATNKC